MPVERFTVLLTALLATLFTALFVVLFVVFFVVPNVLPVLFDTTTFFTAELFTTVLLVITKLFPGSSNSSSNLVTLMFVEISDAFISSWLLDP